MSKIFRFEGGRLHPTDDFRTGFQGLANRGVTDREDVNRLVAREGLSQFGATVAGAVAVVAANTGEGQLTVDKLREDLRIFTTEVKEMDPSVSQRPADLTAFEIGMDAFIAVTEQGLNAVSQGGNA